MNEETTNKQVLNRNKQTEIKKQQTENKQSRSQNQLFHFTPARRNKCAVRKLGIWERDRKTNKKTNQKNKYINIIIN